MELIFARVAHMNVQHANFNHISVHLAKIQNKLLMQKAGVCVLMANIMIGNSKNVSPVAYNAQIVMIKTPVFHVSQIMF